MGPDPGTSAIDTPPLPSFPPASASVGGQPGLLGPMAPTVLAMQPHRAQHPSMLRAHAGHPVHLQHYLQPQQQQQQQQQTQEHDAAPAALQLQHQQQQQPYHQYQQQGHLAYTALGLAPEGLLTQLPLGRQAQTARTAAAATSLQSPHPLLARRPVPTGVDLGPMAAPSGVGGAVHSRSLDQPQVSGGSTTASAECSSGGGTAHRGIYGRTTSASSGGPNAGSHGGDGVANVGLAPGCKRRRTQSADDDAAEHRSCSHSQDGGNERQHSNHSGSQGPPVKTEPASPGPARGPDRTGPAPGPAVDSRVGLLQLPGQGRGLPDGLPAPRTGSPAARLCGNDEEDTDDMSETPVSDTPVTSGSMPRREQRDRQQQEQHDGEQGSGLRADANSGDVLGGQLEGGSGAAPGGAASPVVPPHGSAADTAGGPALGGSNAPSNIDLRSLLGEARFSAVRAGMMRQQSVFVQQLCELHKIARVQQVVWSEMLVLDPAGLAATCTAAGFAGAGPAGPIPVIPPPPAGLEPSADAPRAGASRHPRGQGEGRGPGLTVERRSGSPPHDTRAGGGVPLLLGPIPVRGLVATSQQHQQQQPAGFAQHPGAVQEPFASPRTGEVPAPPLSPKALQERLVADMLLLSNVPRTLRDRVLRGVPPSQRVRRPLPALPASRPVSAPSAGAGGRAGGLLVRPAASKLYTMMQPDSGPTVSEQPSVVQQLLPPRNGSGADNNSGASKLQLPHRAASFPQVAGSPHGLQLHLAGITAAAAAAANAGPHAVPPPGLAFLAASQGAYLLAQAGAYGHAHGHGAGFGSVLAPGQFGSGFRPLSAHQPLLAGTPTLPLGGQAAGPHGFQLPMSLPLAGPWPHGQPAPGGTMQLSAAQQVQQPLPHYGSGAAGVHGVQGSTPALVMGFARPAGIMPPPPSLPGQHHLLSRHPAGMPLPGGGGGFGGMPPPLPPLFSSRLASMAQARPAGPVPPALAASRPVALSAVHDPHEAWFAKHVAGAPPGPAAAPIRPSVPAAMPLAMVAAPTASPVAVPAQAQPSQAPVVAQNGPEPVRPVAVEVRAAGSCARVESAADAGDTTPPLLQSAQQQQQQHQQPPPQQQQQQVPPERSGEASGIVNENGSEGGPGIARPPPQPAASKWWQDPNAAFGELGLVDPQALGNSSATDDGGYMRSTAAVPQGPPLPLKKRAKLMAAAVMAANPASFAAAAAAAMASMGGADPGHPAGFGHPHPLTAVSPELLMASTRLLQPSAFKPVAPRREHSNRGSNRLTQATHTVATESMASGFSGAAGGGGGGGTGAAARRAALSRGVAPARSENEGSRASPRYRTSGNGAVGMRSDVLGSRAGGGGVRSARRYDGEASDLGGVSASGAGEGGAGEGTGMRRTEAGRMRTAAGRVGASGGFDASKAASGRKLLDGGGETSGAFAGAAGGADGGSMAKQGDAFGRGESDSRT